MRDIAMICLQYKAKVQKVVIVEFFIDINQENFKTGYSSFFNFLVSN